MKGIAVYCSSSEQIDKIYYDEAYRLGQAIAKRGVPVVNGGGKMSLMAAVSDGALEAGGEAIGVIPQFMHDADRHHKGLTRLIITPDMRTRKKQMAELSMGVIALPGGIGTLEEITEMMTSRKLGLFDGRVVLLNTNGFYDGLLQWLDNSIKEGFNAPGTTYWQVANTVEEALDIIFADAR